MNYSATVLDHISAALNELRLARSKSSSLWSWGIHSLLTYCRLVLEEDEREVITAFGSEERLQLAEVITLVLSRDGEAVPTPIIDELLSVTHYLRQDCSTANEVAATVLRQLRDEYRELPQRDHTLKAFLPIAMQGACASAAKALSAVGHLDHDKFVLHKTDLSDTEASMLGQAYRELCHHGQQPEAHFPPAGHT